jgi:hypothetical protein
VERGDFSLLEGPALAVRDEVFVRGMGVPSGVEHDTRDHLCVHVLVRMDGEPAATGRLDVDRGGKVGRVAVLRRFRGRGLGSRVMRELESVAAEYGLSGLWCHAQLAAAGFYRRLGWRPVGETFMEAGIEHVRMEKQLRRDGGPGR